MIGRLAAIALGVLAPAAATARDIDTAQGRVAGTTLQNGVQAWLGIPFAAPPVGDLRWKPPRPAAAWTATYQATHFAPSCMQPLRDHGIAYYVGDDPIAEDCLYLNVWAPAAAASNPKRPVIVYVHGGSFVAGSSRKPLYLGDRLAAKGAVVVGVNYRLGELGFLALPEIAAESADHASGNYGLLDQIAALRWVKANIAAFGGDPDNVTIMGQSAGAISIALLQTSPLAKGLFHRIIALSGSPYSSATTDRVTSLEDSQARGLKFQAALGARDLAALRRLPPDRIVAAQGPLALPVIDGLTIPHSPAATFAAREQVDVPLLIGTVRDEALSPLGTVSTLQAYRSTLASMFADKAGAVMKMYPANDDAQARDAARAVAHDVGFSTMMRSWAHLQAAGGKAPIYAYWFDRRHPYSAGVRFSDLDATTTGVNHTDDVPYWLGTFESLNGPRKTRDWTRQDTDLADRMQAALVAFAATGDPNDPALGIDWPRYDPRRERMMGFGDTVRVLSWPDRAKMDALAAIGIPDPRTAKGQHR